MGKRYVPKEGYIQLWRRVRDHRFWPTYSGRKFTELEAWLDLLFDASYRSRKVRCRGRVYELKEGELVFSARDKAKHWGWRRSEMRAFLDALYANGEAVPEDAEGVTHLSIVKLRPFVGWSPTQPPQDSKDAPKKLRSTRSTRSTATPFSPTPMGVLIEPWRNWLKKKGVKE